MIFVGGTSDRSRQRLCHARAHFCKQASHPLGIEYMQLRCPVTATGYRSSNSNSEHINASFRQSPRASFSSSRTALARSSPICKLDGSRQEQGQHLQRERSSASYRSRNERAGPSNDTPNFRSAMAIAISAAPATPGRRLKPCTYADPRFRVSATSTRKLPKFGCALLRWPHGDRLRSFWNRHQRSCCLLRA
jgi:hypothetical protein